MRGSVFRARSGEQTCRSRVLRNIGLIMTEGLLSEVARLDRRLALSQQWIIIHVKGFDIDLRLLKVLAGVSICFAVVTSQSQPSVKETNSPFKRLSGFQRVDSDV